MTIIVAEKGQNYTFTAWRLAKAGRKQLITAMTTEFKGCCFIFCFRAKDATDFEVKPPRKLGWMPISDDDFLFEMTLCALLAPGSDGCADVQIGHVRRAAIPEAAGDSSKASSPESAPLSEDIGRRLAEWAKGGTSSPAQPRVEAAASSSRPPVPNDAAEPSSADAYVSRWQVLIDNASTKAQGEQLHAQWNTEKAIRNLITWPEDDTFDRLKQSVSAALNVLKGK
jgi:hypothetical protein